jgi:hypothetical protein
VLVLVDFLVRDSRMSKYERRERHQQTEEKPMTNQSQKPKTSRYQITEIKRLKSEEYDREGRGRDGSYWFRCRSTKSWICVPAD